MKLLFIHQNFPSQFRSLVNHLVSTGKHEVVALKQPPEVKLEGVGIAAYKFLHKPEEKIHPLLSDMEAKVLRGEAVAYAAERLKAKGYTPDLIIAHPGWGEVLFIKDVWPEVKLLCYFEYYYNAIGQDFDFDKEFSAASLYDLERLRLKNSAIQHALEIADYGWSPTKWQQQTFPAWAQNKIDIIHEGIDTDLFKPDDNASFHMKNKNLTLTRNDEVITYAARSLEPVRGFHMFMRALPKLLAQRPNAHVIIIGREEVSYGLEPEGERSWLTKMLKEVGSQIDPKRVHVVGFLGKEQYRAILQVSKVHVYLTYPFILSWSLLEVMATGIPIVASKTPTITEFIKEGETGRLFDFFDTDAMVAAIVKQLDAPLSQTNKMIKTARDLIEKKYEQSYCVDRLLKLIEYVQYKDTKM